MLQRTAKRDMAFACAIAFARSAARAHNNNNGDGAHAAAAAGAIGAQQLTAQGNISYIISDNQQPSSNAEML